MKLSTRVTLLTTMLVAPALGALGWAALRVRRADLEADLARQAREVAEALRAGIEPLVPETAVADLTDLAWRARERDDAFQLEILKSPDASGGHAWQTSDPGWLVLLQAAEIDDGPVGRFFEGSPGSPPAFAMAVPLYGEAAGALPKRHPARRPIAVLGMRRQAAFVDVAVNATARRVFPLLLAVVVFVAAGVQLALRAGVTAPLRRLLEGIDAVGKGDLSRVLLAEREDEIGTLASRFNAMTASLREAREEARRGVEMRLGLETRLRHSEKLATMGQMAAEIAHEVGTPLNVITGRARALVKKTERAAEKTGGPVPIGAVEATPEEVAKEVAREVKKNVEIIAAQAERITKIINQVLAFSRRRGPTVTRVHLGAVVAEALDFLGESIRRQRIETDVRTMPAPPDVPGDPEQIQQVCLNLLTNALQAMPDGGSLLVRVERVTRRKEGLDLAPPAEYVMLEVADTGEGIAAADRERIFEPFFTTKGEGQGTGLGLAVSHGIVKDHDGWIEVESPPAGAAAGTAFRVFLPVSSAAAAGGGAWAEIAAGRDIGRLA